MANKPVVDSVGPGRASHPHRQRSLNKMRGEAMEAQSKFLGVCILLAAAILAGALVYHAQSGRYQFHPESPIRILDTATGKFSQP